MQKRFWNLDGLRFLAAWVVVICHLEVFKSYAGIETIKGRFFSNSAQVAVTFFFVLSGFLITYLLLAEKKKSDSQKINIPAFYRKRVFRIWPLYYLLVILTFFVFQKITFFAQNPEPGLFKERLIGYSLFLPNYTSIKYGSEMYLGQTWSLGVEEFLYLLFPLAVYTIKMKKFRLFLIFTIALFFILSIGIYYVQLNPEKSFTEYIAVYLDRYRIYSFCLGGLAAWYFLNKGEKTNIILELLAKKQTATVLLVILIILVAGGITFSVATQQLYSLFFAVLLFSFITSEIKFSLLNYPFMLYLGKISYGIYMLHPIAIVITLKFIPAIHHTILNSVVLIICASITTIVLAIISYELYEKRFLNLNRKWK